VEELPDELRGGGRGWKGNCESGKKEGDMYASEISEPRGGDAALVAKCFDEEAGEAEGG
jgi:hypothetical protein